MYIKKGQQWIELESLNSSNFSSKNTKLNELCLYWLDEIKRVSVKPKTFKKYTSTLLLYILPYLGQRKVSSISPQDIQELLNQWNDGTLKGKKGMLYHLVQYVALDGTYLNYLNML